MILATNCDRGIPHIIIQTEKNNTVCINVGDILKTSCSWCDQSETIERAKIINKPCVIKPNVRVSLSLLRTIVRILIYGHYMTILP